jgi:hypothetical protein
MLRETPRPTEVDVKDRARSDTMCEPQPFYRASSTLLSRLAEAVDGNRKGAAVVYVAEYWYRPDRKGHEVHGPFESCEDAYYFRAKELNDEAGKTYGIFGPFWTKKGWGDATARPGSSPRVEQVVVYLTSGQTIEISPDDADAVFWSPAAVEKFVVPYYVAIGTVEEGETILQNLDDGVVLVHRPGSEWRAQSPGIRVDGKRMETDAGLGTVVIGASPNATDPERPDLMASPLV